MSNRTVDLPAIFGDNASTVIPTYPIPGTGYRKDGLVAADVLNGWLFDSVVDSSVHNAVMYALTYLMQQVTQFGFVNWCSTTPYPAGSICRGSNGKIYTAGIDNLDADPVSAPITTWKQWSPPGASQQVIPITASGGGSHSFTVTATGDNSNLLTGSFNIIDAANENMGWHVDIDGVTLYDGSQLVNYMVGFSPTFAAMLDKGAHTVTITLMGGSCQFVNPAGGPGNSGFATLVSY
jgi:hypothetical protein